MQARIVLYALPLAGFIALAVWLAMGLGMDPRNVPSALIDKPAPDFTLPGLDGAGEGFGTADLRAPANEDVVVVNVFASWCIPCRAEHPYLMRWAEDGVTIYGINYRDKPDDARNWLAQLGNPYKRIGVDANARVSIDWGVYGVPETFIVDRSGHIRFKQVGPITTPDLARAFREKIAAARQ
ncbi:MAG: DsbE family thiol:disulfide interchange protein [Alphaproteobacteria bacterium]|nr:DsbE family thiol:disulfide interchange protein [Alphaproteobacteria bacterium]